MLDIYQIAYFLVILVFLGSLAFYISKKVGIPRVALLLIFGFIGGIIGILNRDWFDPTTGSDFPLQMSVELVLIIVLFFGGFSIDIENLKGVLRPGILLATIGAFTVAFTIAFIMNFAFPSLFGGITALIIGSLIAPNDPIAVNSTQDMFDLNPKADTISKLESGLDDTMVTTLIILICIPLGRSIAGQGVIDIMPVIIDGIISFLWLTGTALIIGAGMGLIFCKIYIRIKDKVIKSIVSIILPFLTFTIASLKVFPNGLPISSGYVAVFIAGLVFGRNILKNREEYDLVYNKWDSMFKFCEIFCFILLGALVRPEIFQYVFIPALVITLSIIFITRPLELAICTSRSGLNFKEKLYIGYIGLKGLDPAVLAIAAFGSLSINALGGVTHPLLNGIDLVINLTFAVILFITIGQSIILTLLFGKKGYYTIKAKKSDSLPLIESPIYAIFSHFHEGLIMKEEELLKNE